MPVQFHASQLDKSYSVPPGALGTRIFVPASASGSNPNTGEREYVLVYNADTSALSVGDTVVHDLASGMWKVKPTSGDDDPAVQVAGVVTTAIAAGEYGFVQCRGQATMKTDGTTGVSQGDPLSTYGSTGAAGQVHPASSSTAGAKGIFALALATGTGTFTAFVNCPSA